MNILDKCLPTPYPLNGEEIFLRIYIISVRAYQHKEKKTKFDGHR